jgi:hypothetical protein
MDGFAGNSPSLLRMSSDLQVGGEKNKTVSAWQETAGKKPDYANMAFIIFYSAAVYLLLFKLPWSFPPKKPMVSDSYTFGFNNSVAHLALAALLGVAALYRLIWKHGDGGAARFATIFSEIAEPAIDPQARRIVIGVITVSVIATGIWWWVIPSSYFGETEYFLSRLDLMLDGAQPYRDFNFGYGPLLMLDLPLLLHRSSYGLLALDSAYIATLLFSWALGTWLVYYVLRAFAIKSSTRVITLGLCGLAGFNLTLGVHYTPTRYIWPMFSVVFVWRTLENMRLFFSVAALAKAALLVFLLCVAGFGISADTGLVTMLALSSGIVWTAMFSAPRNVAIGTLVLSPLLAVGAVAAVFGMSYFTLIFSFGSGGYNLPIFPAHYILLLIACACYTVPWLAFNAVTRRTTNGGLFAALTVALGLTLPAALGRCDPGHVFWNALGIFVLTGCVNSLSSSRAVRWGTALVAMLFCGLLMQSFWGHYGDRMLVQLNMRQQISKHREEFNTSTRNVIDALRARGEYKSYPWSKNLPWDMDLLGLLKYPRIATPLRVNEDIERFLKVSGRYLAEYQTGPLSGAFTPEDVQRKIRDLRDAETVMIPKYSLGNVGEVDLTAYSKSQSEDLSALFVWPVRVTAVNPPFFSERLLLQYLVEHYECVEEFRSYLILKRKP